MEQSEQACETAHCSRQPVLREGGASAALSALFTGHFLEGQGGPVQFDIAKFIFFRRLFFFCRLRYNPGLSNCSQQRIFSLGRLRKFIDNFHRTIMNRRASKRIHSGYVTRSLPCRMSADCCVWLPAVVDSDDSDGHIMWVWISKSARTALYNFFWRPSLCHHF